MLSLYDLSFYKEMNRGHKILYVIFNNKEFVFKSLGRKEYQTILALSSDEYEIEDTICQTSLLHPKDYNFAYSTLSGLSHNIAPLIVEISNFTELDSLLGIYEESKIKLDMFDQQCMSLVKAAFPEYRYDEMEDWTWEQLMDFTAKAEHVMKLKGHDIQLINKREEVEQAAKDQVEAYNQEDFINELRMNGIDPMIYFKDKIMKKKEYLEFPIIGGIHWNNEEVLNGIRNQME